MKERKERPENGNPTPVYGEKIFHCEIFDLSKTTWPTTVFHCVSLLCLNFPMADTMQRSDMKSNVITTYCCIIGADTQIACADTQIPCRHPNSTLTLSNGSFTVGDGHSFKTLNTDRTIINVFIMTTDFPINADYKTGTVLYKPPFYLPCLHLYCRVFTPEN